eukprot:9700502-Karenia_brevis.AAC.1
MLQQFDPWARSVGVARESNARTESLPQENQPKVQDHLELRVAKLESVVMNQGKALTSVQTQ